MRCIVTAAAEADLEAIGDYIAEHNPARAVSFVRELRKRCRRLREFPQAYPLHAELAEVAPNVRVMAFRQYLVCYTAHPDRVVIERITQGSRDLQRLFG